MLARCVASFSLRCDDCAVLGMQPRRSCLTRQAVSAQWSKSSGYSRSSMGPTGRVRDAKEGRQRLPAKLDQVLPPWQVNATQATASTEMATIAQSCCMLLHQLSHA